MKKVVFVSYQSPYGEQDSNRQDEAFFKQALLERDIHVETIAWDAPNIAWANYDALVIRTTWDYYLRYEEFLAWLNGVIAQGATFYNAPSLMKWNMDKVYLQELANEGVRLLPTVFIAQNRSANLAQIIASQGWQEAVVKPTISGGGDNTWRVKPHEAQTMQERLNEQVTKTGIMIQQYATQISEGEYSFVFFNGLFSHATRKVPAEGDMFVHEHRGGSTYTFNAPSEMVAKASNILRIAQRLTGQLPLYARVDCIVEGDELILMELEVVEPYLYMPYADEYAKQRFADALAQRLESNT